MPNRRVAPSPEHIAPTVGYLVSDDAADVTGQIFYAEGGEVVLYAPPTPARSVTKEGLWAVDELARACASTFGRSLRPPEMRPRHPL